MDLSDLMRYIAKHQERTVELGVELEQVERYIALQRLRYERPVQVRIEVDTAARAQRIPSMVLLPLVENAFKHGDPCDPHMPLTLEASVQHGMITIRCSNRVGRGTTDGSPHTGNQHLQRRIELLFGVEGRATFTPLDGRYMAELRFPIAS